MIFVTVGEQLPFDRLVRAIDEHAPSLKQDVFAQIGATSFIPANIAYDKFLAPKDFASKFAEADVIVAHAGMGTIITALELDKPIIVMPRQAALREHRNDHQFATAKRFLKLNYIAVAFDENELIEKLEKFTNKVKSISKTKTIAAADPLLIRTISEFLED